MECTNRIRDFEPEDGMPASLSWESLEEGMEMMVSKSDAHSVKSQRGFSPVRDG